MVNAIADIYHSSYYFFKKGRHLYWNQQFKQFVVMFAGDLVAHIKFTVLLMPNGSDRITSHALQELKPTKTIEDEPEIKAWLALGTKTKKKGGGKKKKGACISCCH